MNRTRMQYRSVVAAALFVSISISVTAVVAFGDHRPRGRFDALVLHRIGGGVVVQPRALAQLDPTDQLRVGWESFDGRHGGGWSVHLDERTAMPVLVSGRGIEWLSGSALDGASLADLEARARGFLSEQRALLGDWAAMLELDRDASRKARSGRWQLVFRQVVDGVQVENARLDLHVVRGRLVMFGATHWAPPRTSGVPSLDEEKARAALDAYLGVDTGGFVQAAEPELVLIALDADPGPDGSRPWAGSRGQGVGHALIWRFTFRESGAPGLWIGEVDAHDGSIRAFFDGTRYGAIRGGVFPFSSDGDCAKGGCEIPGFPMPFADYTESGQPEDFADAFGNLACGDPGETFSSALVGPYVRVVDSCGALSESGTCDGGLDLGLKHGEVCDVQPGASAGNTAATRTTFYHINRTTELARFYDPTNAWLNDELTVNVNLSAACNAFWDGEINMHQGSTGCTNTGENHGILIHEWGHGYDQNDGGGYGQHRPRPTATSCHDAGLAGVVLWQQGCSPTAGHLLRRRRHVPDVHRVSRPRTGPRARPTPPRPRQELRD